MMCFLLLLFSMSIVQLVYASTVSVHVRSQSGMNFGNLTVSNGQSLTPSLSHYSSTSTIIHITALDIAPNGSASTSRATNTVAASSLAETKHHNLTSKNHTSSSAVSKTKASAKPTKGTTSAHLKGNHTPSHTHATPTNEPCQSHCRYLGGKVSTLTWTPVCLATLAAHTIIHIVNNRTNATQTITKSLDLAGIGDLGIFSLEGTPSPTKALQTTVTLSRGLNRPVITVLTYPNTIVDYPYDYQVDGVAIDLMLKDIKANTTCGAAETVSTFTFPSHPPLPSETATEDPDDTVDPDGSEATVTADDFVGCRKVVIGDITITPESILTTTILPVWETGSVPLEFYHSAFPDDKAFEKCASSSGRPVLGISFLQAVQFLTETSTLYATGGDPIRTVSSLNTQPNAPTQPEISQLPTAAPDGGSGTAFTTSAAKDIVIPPQFQATSSQPLQLTLGTSIVPIAPVAVSRTVTDGTALVPAFVIGTQTIALGGQDSATIGGTPVAIRTSNDLTFAVIGNSGQASTVQLSPDLINPTITPPPIVVGGTTISPLQQTNAPTFIVAGQTLIPGESIVISGDNAAVIALVTDKSGNAVLAAGGKTTTLSPGPQTATIILGGHTFISQSTPSGYIVSGQTLTFGGAITVQDGSSAKTLSLTTNSLGQTFLLNNGQAATIPSPSPTPFVVDGMTLSPLTSAAAFEYHISNQILTLGGTITIGTTPSLTTLALKTNSAGQTILLQNGKATTLTSSAMILPLTAAATTAGIGAVIGSVMGLGSPAVTAVRSSSSTGFQMASHVATPSSSVGSSLHFAWAWQSVKWIIVSCTSCSAFLVW